MKTIIATLVIVTLLAGLGTALFIYSGVYDVSASTPHSRLVEKILEKTMHASIERRARDIQVPDLDSDELRLAGINDFEAMCVGCHGAPGKEPGPAGQGLNPSAPKLGESAAHMDPAELFWVTKNGIKMTGMPAWGATHGDEELWPVVALLTALPQLDAEAYAALKHRAKGMGHHAHDEPAAGGKMHTESDDKKPAATADRSEPEPEPEHDHNAHSH